MSVTQIEELKKTLTKAKDGKLSDKDFQIVVLKALISLKESHISVRSRLFDLSDQVQVEVSAGNTSRTYSSADSMTRHTAKPPIIDERLKSAREAFNDKSVQLYQTVFLKEPCSDDRKLTFDAAVDLLARLDFRHYGDGRYPLAHYLREIVGAKDMVDFPNFLQAISMAVSKPIPLMYKEAFEEMDGDHNGKLDAKEVFNMLKVVDDSEYSWVEIEEFLKSIDVNHDGKMDYAEMLAAFYFNTQK